jgi:hypothetical protein
MKKTSCCVLLLVSVSLLLLSCGAGSSNNGGGVGCNAQQGTTCQSLTINGVTRTYTHLVYRSHGRFRSSPFQP